MLIIYVIKQQTSTAKHVWIGHAQASDAITLVTGCTSTFALAPEASLPNVVGVLKVYFQLLAESQTRSLKFYLPSLKLPKGKKSQEQILA